MLTISTQEPLAVAAVEAIHTGNVDALQRLLAEHPDLATARLGDHDHDTGMTRSLLHVVTDWPGHQLDTVDEPRVDEFLAAFVQGPQTPEPGAVCTGGAGEPAT